MFSLVHDLEYCIFQVLISEATGECECLLEDVNVYVNVYVIVYVFPRYAVPRSI